MIMMANARHLLGQRALEHKALCCGEEPRDPEVRVLPALSSSAPAWSGVAVTESKLKDISLGDYKGMYLILLFYPYDFTFICPTEIIQFSDRVDEFQKLGTR